MKVKSLGRVRLLATPWTAAYQAPPSMGFSRQEYWSRVPLPSPYPLITAVLITAVLKSKDNYKIAIKRKIIDEPFSGMSLNDDDFC